VHWFEHWFEHRLRFGDRESRAPTFAHRHQEMSGARFLPCWLLAIAH
jgi:hypothetical protein